MTTDKIENSYMTQIKSHTHIHIMPAIFGSCVAALGAVIVGTGTVSAFGLVRRIDSALRNGCGRLALHLRQDLGYGLLRHRARHNWNGRKRGYLHGTLHVWEKTQRVVILTALYQKIINHFVVQYRMDKPKSMKDLGLFLGNRKGFSQCQMAGLS